MADADHLGIPYTRGELARLLRVTTNTLIAWERKKFGPTPIRLSPKRTIYSRSDVEQFVRSRTIGSAA